MNTNEIIQLTRESIRDLIRLRQGASHGFPGREHRRAPRWPFPGTVELHATDCTTGQWFATCGDISETGLGMCGEHYFCPEMIVDIAIHLPEATLYGRAIVRHCQKTGPGLSSCSRLESFVLHGRCANCRPYAVEV